MKWNEKLPNTNLWQPQSSKQDTLRNALMLTCQIAQRRIVQKAKEESAFNIQNFDSGLGVEDVVRQELGRLLPKRYSIDVGVVNDRLGCTADECDLLIRNHMWSPIIKPGATNASRRSHFPIEGVYAAMEIKQTLGLRQLDEAMEKLVVLSRLNRRENPYGHITENQHIRDFDVPGLTLNPLHTTVLATKLEEGLSFHELARRFGAINSLLNRNHMVTMLCVLGYGTAWYSVTSGNPYDADFMRDRNERLVLQVNPREPDNAFYRLYVLLMMHLTRSVLGLSDVFQAYGSPPPKRTLVCYPQAEFNKISARAR